MSFSDETLMAYAGGALDEATQRAVERAMRLNEIVARRVARHKAMRPGLSAALAPMAQPPLRSATVVHLDAIRASRAAAAAARTGKTRRWSWRKSGAVAALLIAGMAVALGWSKWQADGPAAGSHAATVSGEKGALTAQGQLARALSQLPAAAADGSVRIGVSFVSTDGRYCRSFTLGGARHLAGLACRAGQEWHIAMIVQEDRPHTGAAAMAAAGVSTLVLAAIDQRIDGQALDVTAEQEALRKGWQR